jgi:type II secretory pathway component GspD/PulD (secretin)
LCCASALALATAPSGRADVGASPDSSADASPDTSAVPAVAEPAETTRFFWAIPGLPDDALDVHFRDVDVVEAIRFLAGPETNVVALGFTPGAVSMDLRRVLPGRALDSVLRSLGVCGRIEGNTLFLSEVEDRVMRIPIVVQDKSAVWDELESAITGLLSPDGRLALNKSGGVLTVSDRPPDLDRTEEHVIEVLEAMTRQIEIEIKVIEAVYRKNDGAGIEWALFDGILDPAWSLGGGTSTGDVAFQSVTDAHDNFQLGILKPGKWQAFLDAFDENIRLNMISRPRITTLSNQPATFEVKEKVPYLTKTISQEGGVSRTDFALQFDEAGIEMVVTAAVAEGGEISMEVHPTISTVVGFTASLPDLGPQPIIDTRETKSLVRLAEGSSLVIGGMLQDRKNVSTLGVPVLSRLPGLGRLFRSEQVRNDKTEIIIVLTPRARREPGARTLERWGRLDRVTVAAGDGTMGTRLAAARDERAWDTIRAGETSRALVEARSAAVASPSAWWTVNDVGLALQQVGFLGDAELALRTAVRATDPSEPVALLNWGTLLVHRGRAEDAVAPLREAASRAPRGAVRDEAILAWALALELSGRTQEALDVLEHDAGGPSGPLGDRVRPRTARLLARMGAVSSR